MAANPSHTHSDTPITHRRRYLSRIDDTGVVLDALGRACHVADLDT